MYNVVEIPAIVRHKLLKSNMAISYRNGNKIKRTKLIVCKSIPLAVEIPNLWS